MKKAIINYINARAKRIRPCEHDWELIEKAEFTSRLNPTFCWNKWTYRCKKCCESKIIENN